MNYHALAEKVTQHALGFFSAPGHQYLSYHNLGHTGGVVKAAIQIGNHYQLNDHDFFVVLTAAWFHDMGYFTAARAAHEAASADLAIKFLQAEQVEESTILQVADCIMATRLPQTPNNQLAAIVCDADLFHLGTDAFWERNKLMRKESETVHIASTDKSAWREGTIRLLQSHHYHTDYCIALLGVKKQENLAKLLQKQQESTNKKTTEKVTGNNSNTITATIETKKQPIHSIGTRPDKGIETMFRVAATNHQRLSDMSDNKAHIMISVNAIIISVIIGLVVRKMDSSPNILLPTLLLLTGSMVAIVFAVLATRPKIPDGLFTKAQVADKTVNLLFFGNFYRMDYQEYYDGMMKVMADRDFLYGSLTRDIYSQGKVLGLKYKLLRVSYTIFMYTLIVSIIAFGIVSIYFV